VCVLPARSGDLIRPLIRVRKADVLAHLERHQLRYARDPSNLDSRFQRTRLRCEVLPLLESIAPGAVDHLNLFADALAAGPPPTVLDALGNAVPLGRAQVAAIRRAQVQQPGKPSRTRIRLSGGRELAIDAKTRTYEVVEPASEKRDAG
jgi:hypothetical protein